jgi:hypothetical protein
MIKALLDELSYSFEGKKITRYLRNRGRLRHLISQLITQRLKRRVKKLIDGVSSLPKAGKYNLPAISLTSYPPRYNSLPLVLLNLLEQSKLPPKIYVWIAQDDYNLLDCQLIDLFQSSIVEFHKTKDYGCHKKWIDLVNENDKPFVICDDDIFYPKHWYQSLIDSDDGISYIGHRCHSINMSSNLEILPYSEWDKDIQMLGYSSHRLFPVGCGGTLIYPDRISSNFKDWSLISKLCPKADDVWLKLAHLRSEIPCKKSLYSFPCLEYTGSQKISLMQTNVDAGYNDFQIKNCFEELDIDLKQYFF